MKRIFRLRTTTMALVVALAAGAALVGCERDLYDPNEGKQELPDPGTLPDFNTRSAVELSVDYEAPGFKTLVEVFTEYPYALSATGDVVKKEITPLFAAYTDDNAKLKARFALAADVKQVYLHCPSMGMPRCVALDVVGNRIDFKTSDLAAGSPLQTRANISSPSGSNAPWSLEANFASLCQWNRYGKPTNERYLTAIDGTQDILQKIQSLLWNGALSKPSTLDNSKYAKGAKYTNLSIANWVEEEGAIVPVMSAVIKLNFLQEAAWDQNVFGYYYYPSDKVPAKAADVKKYVIFPNVSTADTPPFNGASVDYRELNAIKNAPLQKSQQITLLYEDAQGVVSANFPPGYTIGWFIISDGYTCKGGSVNTSGTYLYSNEAWNQDGKTRCIAMNYNNEKVVLGFEDSKDNSYEDLLFFLESNPQGAIINPDQPVIKPDEPEIELPDSKEERYGTLAFEDNWPKAGDYDMNDVIVEYDRTVWFNSKNEVTKILDTFQAVQPKGSADFNNAFAYQVDPAQVGTYALPDGAVYEAETNSFIVFEDARSASGEYQIVREFNEGATFKKDQLKEYNPYIIVKFSPENKQRVEIHLPKGQPTKYADKALVGTVDDAYFINKDGKYPFAFDLPIHGFVPVTEQSRIGEENEYAGFIQWVGSGCKENTDWYKRK